jgi:hypothetical protein
MGKQIKEGTRSFLFQRKLRTLLTRWSWMYVEDELVSEGGASILSLEISRAARERKTRTRVDGIVL